MIRSLPLFGRIVLALVCALLAHYVLLFAFPAQLHTSTRIIGYPIHANFNIDRLFWWAYVPLLFLPAASLAIYLGWLFQPEDIRQRSHAGYGRSPRGLGTFARRWVLGGTLGLIAVPAYGASPTATFVGAGLFYAALRALTDRVRPFAGLDAFLSLGSLGTLWAFSAKTGVVQGDGVFAAFPWLPAPWAVSVAALIAAAWLLARRSRVPSSGGRYADRVAVPTLVGAVLTYLWIARLPGAIGISDDFFHSGESLASAKLMLKGLFPWRDLLFIHGLLEDPLKSALGYKLFGTSIWASAAGQDLYLGPLCLVFFFLLYRALFSRNLWFLVGVAFLLPATADPFWTFESLQIRSLLYPLVLLSCLRLLQRRTAWRAFVFASLLFWQVFLTPEVTYLAPAFAVVIAAFEWSRRDRDNPALRDFRATLTCAGVGVAYAAALGLFLERHRALGSFLDYYRIFASGHRFTGGVPLQSGAQKFKFAMYVPVANLVGLTWYLGMKALRKNRLHPVDWLMVAIALFQILYYQKFVSRADWHVWQPYALGLPLTYFLLYRLVGAADRAIGRRAPRSAARWWRQPVACLAVIGIAMPRIGSVRSVFEGSLEKLRPQIAAEGLGGSERYAIPEGEMINLPGDYRAFFGRYLEPGDKLFDFTNQPFLFFYLLDRQPATRYFHVSMATNDLAQEDLISELERERPKLVAYESDRGLGEWDGITNMVRHYRVSEYLLTHYTAFHTIHGTLFLKRKDLPWTADRAIPGIGLRECDWGFVPYFWRTRETTLPGAPLPFQTRRSGDHYLTEIDVPGGTFRSPTRIEIKLASTRADRFELADSPERTAIAGARIAFQVPETRQPYVYSVEAGSCYSWYLARGNKLYLKSKNPQPISAIRVSSEPLAEGRQSAR